MSGLFGTLNIGKSGLFASQKAVNVTSHNISNANTEGYSRQRVNLVTTRPETTSASDAGQIGTGVKVDTVTRVRDNFLDYQVRVELATKGQYDIQDEYLTQVENVMNEPSDTGVSTLLGKFYSSWQSLSKQADTTSAKTLVAQQSKALTDELNHTYTEFQSLKANAQSNIKDSVSEINNILNQVSSLNQEIMQVKIAGQEPNDLMDSRDKLLDELSSNFGISIDKKNFDAVDVSADGGTDNFIQTLNPDSEYRLSYVTNIVDNTDGTYDVTYYKNGDPNASTTETLTMSATEYNSLNKGRVLLTSEDNSGPSKVFSPSSGELCGYAQVQTYIDGYVDELNKFSKALAFSVNELFTNNNTGSIDFFVNSSGGTETDINAGNITVNQSIMSDSSLITAGISSTSGTGDGNRALAIADLKDVNLMVQNITDTTTRAQFISDCGGMVQDTTNFGGLYVLKSTTGGICLDDYFNNTIDKVGVQAQQASRMVTNQETLLTGFKESRNSVSGVSLDEETVNLITYQRAYQANAKIISTVDELLDVVINGLKK